MTDTITSTARQSLLNIGTSLGFNWSVFTDEQLEWYLEGVYEYFDQYTRHGLDFASAFIRAVECVNRDIREAQKGINT